MRRAQCCGVLLNKGLEDAIDVRANGFAIGRAVVLDVYGTRGGHGRGQERNAKDEREKRKAEDSQSHQHNLHISCLL